MNEYVIDIDSAQDYCPPARVYPLNVYANSGVFLGRSYQVEEYKGFKIGEYVAYANTPNRPYTKIALFFESKNGDPAILYEHGGWDLMSRLVPYKETK